MSACSSSPSPVQETIEVAAGNHRRVKVSGAGRDRAGAVGPERHGAVGGTGFVNQRPPALRVLGPPLDAGIAPTVFIEEPERIDPRLRHIDTKQGRSDRPLAVELAEHQAGVVANAHHHRAAGRRGGISEEVHAEVVVHHDDRDGHASRATPDTRQPAGCALAVFVNQHHRNGPGGLCPEAMRCNLAAGITMEQGDISRQRSGVVGQVRGPGRVAQDRPGHQRHLGQGAAKPLPVGNSRRDTKVPAGHFRRSQHAQPHVRAGAVP